MDITPIPRAQKPRSLRIAHLPANQAWCLILGTTIIPVNDGEKSLFDSKPEIEDALLECGLKVNRDFTVSSVAMH